MITAKDIPPIVSVILDKPDGHTVSVKEYAALIGRAVGTTRQRIKSEGIRTVKDGHYTALYKRDVLRYIEKIYPNVYGSARK